MSLSNEFRTKYDENEIEAGVNPTGTIISFMGNNAPIGYLKCDGTEYNIADYPILAAHFEKEFGTKNNFGGDGITTFAVPDARERYFKGSDTAGTYTEAGLPNITGDYYHNVWLAANVTGAFRSINTGTLGANVYGTSGKPSGFSFNASRSNAIYGNSNTVTPKNISVLYCIKY